MPKLFYWLNIVNIYDKIIMPQQINLSRIAHNKMGDFMSRLKKSIKHLFIFLCCGLLFFFSAYLYLYTGLNNSKEAETKENSIPYEKAVPEDTGLLIKFESGSAVMIFLDFSYERILAAVIDDYTDGAEQRLGYDIQYTLQTDATFLEGIVDKLGGIDLDIQNTPLRYTGVQVCDLISRNTDVELKRQILSSIFTKISKVGFSTDGFVFMIENSDTALTVPDCIYWAEHLKNMCMRYMIIN